MNITVKKTLICESLMSHSVQQLKQKSQNYRISGLNPKKQDSAHLATLLQEMDRVQPKTLKKALP